MEELEKGISSLTPGKAIGLDKISTEQIMNFGPVAKRWLLQLFNHLATHKFPKIWRKEHVMALLKPGKDPSVPKTIRPLSLLSHACKLFERLLLNRIGPVVDNLLIPEQAGFHPGKSTTSQVRSQPYPVHRGWFWGRESYWSSVCWPLSCLRYSEPQVPPSQDPGAHQGYPSYWTDRKHAWEQTFFRWAG